MMAEDGYLREIDWAGICAVGVATHGRKKWPPA